MLLILFLIDDENEFSSLQQQSWARTSRANLSVCLFSSANLVVDFYWDDVIKSFVSRTLQDSKLKKPISLMMRRLHWRTGQGASLGSRALSSSRQMHIARNLPESARGSGPWATLGRSVRALFSNASFLQ